MASSASSHKSKFCGICKKIMDPDDSSAVTKSYEKNDLSVCTLEYHHHCYWSRVAAAIEARAKFGDESETDEFCDSDEERRAEEEATEEEKERDRQSLQRMYEIIERKRRQAGLLD